MQIYVDASSCTGCGVCLPSCPYGALLLDDEGPARVQPVLCDGCGACLQACPEGAILCYETLPAGPSVPETAALMGAPPAGQQPARRPGAVVGPVPHPPLLERVAAFGARVLETVGPALADMLAAEIDRKRAATRPRLSGRRGGGQRRLRRRAG